MSSPSSRGGVDVELVVRAAPSAGPREHVEICRIEDLRRRHHAGGAILMTAGIALTAKC